MPHIKIDIVDDADVTCLALVTRMCMETVLETIPEFYGKEEVARQHLPNFEFGEMYSMMCRSASHPEHRILVATSGDVIVGYSIVSLKSNADGTRFGYLFSRGVAEPYRRRGIATRLLLAAEEWFRRNGAAYAQAETHESNAPLRELLTRNGFAVVEHGVGSWPFVVLRKSLDRPDRFDRQDIHYEATMDDSTLTTALVSQYQAALAMFRNAVGALPAARWDDPADRNATWRIAYHALFFTQLYLSGSEEAFDPWIAEDPATFDEPFELPAGTPARPVEQMLAYADAIEAMLPSLVPVIAYDGPSGFSWISISRFEHHIYNIRHLQHHTGQIAERARASGGDGLEWTGRGAAARIYDEGARLVPRPASGPTTA